MIRLIKGIIRINPGRRDYARLQGEGGVRMSLCEHLVRPFLTKKWDLELFFKEFIETVCQVKEEGIKPFPMIPRSQGR